MGASAVLKRRGGGSGFRTFGMGPQDVRSGKTGISAWKRTIITKHRLIIDVYEISDSLLKICLP
jgi:hypothetical protein